MQRFRIRVNVFPNRMIVIVGQSHTDRNSFIIVVDACPFNSSICLFKSYPNPMSVFFFFSMWACTHPDSMVVINGWHTAPISMVVSAVRDLHWKIHDNFYLNSILASWINTHPDVLFVVLD